LEASDGESENGTDFSPSTWVSHVSVIPPKLDTHSFVDRRRNAILKIESVFKNPYLNTSSLACMSIATDGDEQAAKHKLSTLKDYL
jgi:hypothetical protein